MEAEYQLTAEEAEKDGLSCKMAGGSFAYRVCNGNLHLAVDSL